MYNTLVVSNFHIQIYDDNIFPTFYDVKTCAHNLYNFGQQNMVDV